MSSWVRTLIYAKAGHLSIIVLRFSTRVFIFIMRRKMCMWTRRCPENACQAIAESNNSTWEDVWIKRMDVLLSCAWAVQWTTLRYGPRLLTMPVFVSPLQTSERESTDTFHIPHTKIRIFSYFSSHKRGGTHACPPRIIRAHVTWEFVSFFRDPTVTLLHQICRDVRSLLYLYFQRRLFDVCQVLSIFKLLPLRFPEFTGPSTQLLEQSWSRSPFILRTSRNARCLEQFLLRVRQDSLARESSTL